MARDPRLQPEAQGLFDDCLAVWLINLPRAIARRETMQGQLDATGITYSIIDGVDGNAEAAGIAQHVDEAAFMRNTGRRILWGGIGCYLSHLQVWRAFLATDKPVALVIEDDAVLHDDFCEAVTLALQVLPLWDILKLSRGMAALPIRQGFVGRYALNAYLGPTTGTSAYLINRATAEQLLQKMLPITRPTDHELGRFFAHDFRLLGMEPFPSHPDRSLESLITGALPYRHFKFSRHKRLYHYCLRAANYLRRFLYLARHGMIWPQRKQLAENTSHKSAERAKA
ncbi:MAG: glycosyltransferase family 25 protein [Phaeovulum sp.]|uniref:glycosyltransferase family 25 protein n=1 Tax=Phaeovulum sp. TaxID=2934796 RepID=UPI002733955D|nr:glycosyltransferase family 25 protein [Phaeovulum sp.]MDP3861768.1 glycosyltransferase family 25 protein [Phaeovulum sp.]